MATKQVHIHIHRTKARDADEGEGKGGKWVTLSPSGTHVKIGKGGEVTAGPKGLSLGKKESSSGGKPAEKKPAGNYSPKGAPAKASTVSRQESLREMGSPRYTGKGGSVAQKNSTPAIATRHSNRGASALAQLQAQSNAHLKATGQGHLVKPAKNAPGTGTPSKAQQARQFEEQAAKLHQQAQAEYQKNGRTDEYVRLKNEAQKATNQGTDLIVQAEAEARAPKPGPDGKPMGIHPALAAVTPPGFPTPGSQEGNRVRVNQATGELSQVGKTPAQPQQADWSKSNGDWTAAKKEGAEMFERAMSSAKSGGARTDAALKLKAEAAEQQKKGSYLGAVVLGLANDYFDRLK